MTKKIIIPATHFKGQGIYEILVSEEYWKEFQDMLKSIAKIKGKQVTFKVRDSNQNSCG